ncbi:High mobility group B protein 2 [Glycine max]|nr:High mobility group B protein 2 [Glycine max]
MSVHRRRTTIRYTPFSESTSTTRAVGNQQLCGKGLFVATTEKKKQEYEKTILAYNKKLEGKNLEEYESDKLKSEVNGDEVDGY